MTPFSSASRWSGHWANSLKVIFLEGRIWEIVTEYKKLVLPFVTCLCHLSAQVWGYGPARRDWTSLTPWCHELAEGMAAGSWRPQTLRAGSWSHLIKLCITYHLQWEWLKKQQQNSSINDSGFFNLTLLFFWSAGSCLGKQGHQQTLTAPASASSWGQLSCHCPFLGTWAEEESDERFGTDTPEEPKCLLGSVANPSVES